MIEDIKLEWEFIVKRAYTPLAYSFNIHLNNKRYLKKYIDITDNIVDAHLFLPDDIY